MVDRHAVHCEVMVAFFADTHIKNSRLAPGAIFGNEPQARGKNIYFGTNNGHC